MTIRDHLRDRLATLSEAEREELAGVGERLLALFLVEVLPPRETSPKRKGAELVERWVGERCRPKARARMFTRTLYADFANWAAGQHLSWPPSRVFAERLEELGVRRWNGRPGFAGIALAPAAPQSEGALAALPGGGDGAA